MQFSKYLAYSTALASLALSLPMFTASAQETDDEPGSKRLNTVVVQARRQEESIQDTPVAVTAVDEVTLNRAFPNDTTAIAQFSPNVVLDKQEAGTASGASFSIRGISYQDVEKAFDPTVLLFVDDIAIGTGTGSVMSLLDVEQVEVLRGPQGTLFGKNAVGGVVHLRRKKPQLDSIGGKVQATLGNFDTTNLQGTVNLGGEKVALKLTAANFDHGGYFENRATDLATGTSLGLPDEDEKENTIFSGHVLFQPTDRLSFELQGTTSELSGSAAPVLNISDNATPGTGDLLCWLAGQCAPGPGQPQGGDPQVSLANFTSVVELETDMYSWRGEYDVSDNLSLTYIGGHMQSDELTQTDFDGSPITFFNTFRPSEYSQDSHELRLTGNTDRLNGQLGLYFWEAESDGLNNAPGVVDRTETTSESFSIYGEADYEFTPQWIGTVGARYIEEDKTMTKTVSDGMGSFTIPTTVFDRSDDDIIWRLGLRREFENGNMGYFTYSTGFRSGGFSPRAATLDALGDGFAPETLTNFELGAKTEWADGRFILNAAFFHMIYEDMQLELSVAAPAPINQQQAIINAGEANITGLEVDFAGQLTDNWSVQGSIGLLDASYEQFIGDLFSEGVNSDFSNLDLRRAPDTTFSLSSTYEQEMFGGTGYARVGYNYRSDYEGTTNNHPGTQIDGYGLLDASVGLERNNWSVSLFGNNLTDEDAFVHTFVVSPSIDRTTGTQGSFWKFAMPRTPMTYGVQLKVNFGDY